MLAIFIEIRTLTVYVSVGWVHVIDISICWELVIWYFSLTFHCYWSTSYHRYALGEYLVILMFMHHHLSAYILSNPEFFPRETVISRLFMPIGLSLLATKVVWSVSLIWWDCLLWHLISLWCNFFILHISPCLDFSLSYSFNPLLAFLIFFCPSLPWRIKQIHENLFLELLFHNWHASPLCTQK